MFNKFKKENVAGTPDHVFFGDKRVEIPRLSVGKWLSMMERVETLPQLIANAVSARNTEMFLPTLMVGSLLAMEEAISLIAVLSEASEDEVREADLVQLHDFLKYTIEKNNLEEAAKKYRAAIQSVMQKMQGVAKKNSP
ncbi:hypothetical protein MKX40_10645 [Paenibacillus sp. FSL R5-0517]|uniref:hypothetical protein n=1 Tax=Paenibacillus sp. FSL R5-0517 TaxID=2921647 RepID=UPI0030DC9CE0